MICFLSFFPFINLHFFLYLLSLSLCMSAYMLVKRSVPFHSEEGRQTKKKHSPTCASNKSVSSSSWTSWPSWLVSPRVTLPSKADILRHITGWIDIRVCQVDWVEKVQSAMPTGSLRPPFCSSPPLPVLYPQFSAPSPSLCSPLPLSVLPPPFPQPIPFCFPPPRPPKTNKRAGMGV